ncbi:NADPH-dependent F420 reductase [Rarobacter faecitabidus]|uniref:Pyrroline-5-carboxylate reductase catalytic N-terminal domain-containing protein n=1 Tax=Rarobacter faecitabidus TaxID=13243 RepID=A0A542ZUX1_RARFA|nr:NADPH-dependent F420 reductase [Rarobacter faecitabidus]TQL64132.1 hypothetical protein FB461_0623 [Rarobacter faecitabidus]
MTTFNVIGAGNMGNAISALLAAGGSQVTTITHSELAATPLDADVVVLAVPYPSISEIVEDKRDELAGKVVVDISNPLNFETFDSLVVPADSSAAAELQAKLPDSRVIKAFNTNFAATLASRSVGQNPATVLVAGDDEGAKAALISAVKAGGVAAIDAGKLARARELEAVGFLQLTFAVGEKISWTAGFALVS